MYKYKTLGIGVLVVGVLVLQGCGTQEQIQQQNHTNEQMQKQTNKTDQVNGVGGGMHADDQMHASIEAIALADLDAAETADIMYMREEEKLARDVYMTLGEKWGQNVFNNIQQSEQSHMDEIKLLIDRYELTDPVATDVPGTFTSPELQKLHDALIAQGEASLLDALTVGATIEDLDIKDIQDALSRTDNEDVKVIFTNLMEGSQKHLQSFVSNIEKQGGTYTPQYITQADYDTIIAMDRMTGGKSQGDGLQDGSGVGQGNGAGDGAGSGRY